MAVSPETRPSLLVRIRDGEDRDSWSQFVAIYAPLVYGFLRKRGLQDSDSADITQEVMMSVAAAVKSFEYDPALGSFRGWLFTIVQNRLRNFWRGDGRQTGGTGDTQAHELLMAQPDPRGTEGDDWNRDYERQLFRRATDRVRGCFNDSTWRAFWITAVEGRSAKEVASALRMSVAAVHLAKGRVIRRIKREVALLEGEST
jgi:RNA polymerase sigma-70 factor (ECF subfamily)